MKPEIPTEARIPGLRQLWQEAFGDSDAFLDAFFQYGFSPRRCRCALEGERVVSALYWFEGAGGQYAYLYAIATAADCRGRGLFRALLEQVRQELQEAGCAALLLVPETETLRRMYEKMGFFSCAPVQQTEVTAGEVPCAMEEVGPETFHRLRQDLLPEGAVTLDALPYLASQYRFFAGEGFLAAGQVLDGKFYCQEYLGDSRPMAGLLKALGAHTGMFRCPGGETPFAMMLPLKKDVPVPDYFAWALD